MKIVRQSILNKLLSVEPGVQNKGPIQQSSCIVLRRGRFYSLSQEIACSLISGLPTEWEGAINAETFIGYLKDLPEEELEMTMSDSLKSLNIKGRGRMVKLNLEAEIVLPVDEVERPKNWTDLGDGFGEAIDLTSKCTKKMNAKQKVELLHTCIHMTPDWIEASDNVKFLRYTIPTFVKQPIFIRGESIKEIVDLGVTKGCETENWVHFYNPMGLRISVRKFLAERYPDFTPFLSFKGKKVIFPRGLESGADLASKINEESIHLTVTEECLLVRGLSIRGEYTERRRVEYQGPDMAFDIPPKLIAELVKQNTQCLLTDSYLTVDGGRYIYVTCLEVKDDEERTGNQEVQG